MKLRLFFLLLTLPLLSNYAQNIEFSSNVELNALLYSGAESPFWFHANKRGRINETTNLSGLANVSAIYQLSASSYLEAGIGALYQDGYNDELQLDESYLAFKNNWFSVIAGRKQRELLYRGLSASNENIVWSLNSRPLPGIRVFTNRPIFFKNNQGLGFEASWEEYLMDDERYIDNARLHHKSVNLVYKHSPKFQISAGLQHFVQWAGTHPEYGDLPSNFKAYTKVVTGKGVSESAGDDVSEQEVNGLGNHLGSYEIKLNTILAGYRVELIYNHLFEDGSGAELANTPDGRYGVYVEDPGAVNNWFQAVMYELYYTKNQSKNTPTSDGIDNYFNNNLYRSGWTYGNRVMGVPFITQGKDRFRIENNKVVVHHLGITGNAFNKYPYRILGSYRQNYGGKGSSYKAHDVFSTYLDLNLMQNYVNLNLQLGADFNEISTPNFAAGLSLSKKIL